MEVGDGKGCIERVDDIGIARFAELVAMALRREFIGLFDQANAILWQVGTDALKQALVLLHVVNLSQYHRVTTLA